MRNAILIASLSLILLSPILAADFALTEADIAISHMLPSVGREVTFTVTIRPPAGAPIPAAARVSAVIEGHQLPSAPPSTTGENARAQFVWLPERDGWHRITFTLDVPDDANPDNNTVTLRLPVTVKPLYFVWFGTPREFDWCNVPTTVKPEDVDWWLQRGAIPCRWKGGICYKEWGPEQFVASYTDSPWIAIDELAGLDEAGLKIMDAVRAHKQAHREGFRLLWSIGAHEYWRDYTDCVDLFVPEIYLNYRGNHLGQFDACFRTIRAAGVMDRMVPGLGVNVRKDEDTGEVIVAPTREDALRQVRYLKTIASEIPGIGFFSTGTAPGVGEYCDQLCRDYYVEPVVSLVEGSLRAELDGDLVRISASVHNVGGMRARDVCVQFGHWVDGEFIPTAESVLETLPVNAPQTVHADVPLQTPVGTCGCRIRESAGYTVLNGEESLVTARPDVAQPGPVVYQHRNQTTAPGLPLFAAWPADGQSADAYLLAPDGTAGAPATATVLPPLPGEPDALLTWTPTELPATGPAVFRLRQAARVDAPPQLVRRDGSIVTLPMPHYTALLDVATDAITSLTPAGSETNIISGPWAFSSTGKDSYGDPVVDEQPGGVLVTVAFRSDLAEGFSRYFFYSTAPVIRIERYLKPHGELTVTASSEGCRLAQQGGSFALQPGVGGAVRRGELQDGSDYRDLLFGYLGEHPTPYTADRCGWIDFSFREDVQAGMGVAIERRWQAAKSKVYDVTRFYDASDYIQILNLWQAEVTITDPQTQIIYLLPHRFLDLTDETVIPPAQTLWDNLHNRCVEAVTE